MIKVFSDVKTDLLGIWADLAEPKSVSLVQVAIATILALPFGILGLIFKALSMMFFCMAKYPGAVIRWANVRFSLIKHQGEGYPVNN